MIKVYSEANALTFGAIKPSGGCSLLRAKLLILVPEMKIKSSFLSGSKNAIFLALLSYAATLNGIISKCWSPKNKKIKS